MVICIQEKLRRWMERIAMRMTQESDYALRIVYYLANTNEERVGASVIATAQEIPLRFTLKILRKLNAAGITKAYRGVTGGYALSRPAKEISYKDVIEAVEGNIHINKCLGENAHCNRNAMEYCKVHKKLLKIQKMLTEQLENTRF